MREDKLHQLDSHGLAPGRGQEVGRFLITNALHLQRRRSGPGNSRGVGSGRGGIVGDDITEGKITL